MCFCVGRERLLLSICLEYGTVWLLLKLLLICFDIQSMHANQLELIINGKFTYSV